jgi:Uma2 family endonuclease
MNTHFRPPDMPMTTRAADDMARRRWSVAEIEAMVEAGVIPPDERFELIEGDVVPMSPKGARHELYKASLLEYWITRKTSNYRIIPETTFHLDASTFLEPDFVFYTSKIKVPELSPAHTLLAVEISDTTLAYDKGRKAKLYARHGIPALWVIDVTTLAIHVFSAPNQDGYQDEQIIPPTTPLTPGFAPELLVALADLPLI